MSGQGPYFGQAMWFTTYHPEQLPSVIDRYRNEILRIVGVLDKHLIDKGTDYLIGDNVSYPDLMMATWNSKLGQLLPADSDWESRFSHFAAWRKRIMDRAAVNKTLTTAAEKMAALGF
jgi:glutathione S-transferase